ncbi:MAG: carbohydrate kinase family protein [Gemmatimonadaceae bacterium]|nr:carbohydrate kinase family protein [Gemmatimonadaceae bacterium]
MAPKRVGIIGSFVWDVIHGRDTAAARSAPLEEWGGIAYSLAAFDAALGPGWESVPIVKVGEDLAGRARDYLRTLRRVAPDAAPVVVPHRNNRVTLVYRDAERRTETLSGGVPGWTWAGLAPLVRGLDALYVNLMSGWELDLDTFRILRQQFRGPIYCDIHSLSLDHRDGGERSPQPVPDAGEWFRCMDIVQMNEDEMAMMARDPLALSAMALGAGASVLVVTLGARGAVYFAAPGFARLGDLGRGAGNRISARGGPVRTALARGVPARIPQGGDPTGCGDVWGATFFARLLDGDIMSDALDAAMCAAARNVEHRGASGLAHHLRGELSHS